MTANNDLRCKAIKKDGKRCTYAAKISGFCGRHKGFADKISDPRAKYKLPWEESNTLANHPFSVGLYYPWIDIKDKSWMKSAALYWDKIRTIVPESIQEPYSNRTAREFCDEGVLEPLIVNPDMGDIDDLTKDVLRYLECQETAELLLSRQRHNNTRIHTQKMPREISNLARLHPEKLSYVVQDMIEEIGLATKSSDGWLSIHPEFANFYMTLLATRLSNRIGAGLLTPSFLSEKVSLNARTDSSLSGLLKRESDNRVGYRSRHMRSIPRKLVQGMLVNVALEKIALDPRTSVNKIIKFREDYADELGRFRGEISSLAARIPSNVPLQHAQQVAKDIYTSEVYPAMKDLKDALKGCHIKFWARSLMNISFLSMGSSTLWGGMAIDFPSAMLIGSGITMTAMGMMFNVDRRREINRNPYSYLLSVDRDLG